MTRGVLLFAIDTEKRQYTKMANYCAAKIRQHLNLPVTVVTTGGVDRRLFDQIIVTSPTKNQQRGISGRLEPWKNFDRYSAYELSPYDETILLDTDYICNSPQLLKLFELNQNFLCHKHRRYLGAHWESTIETFGKNYDMYWATVVYFKKSPEANSVFDMMKMIQDNYDHYGKIYGFRSNPYRNDYAISIALNAVYGHTVPGSVEIPWNLVNVEFDTTVKIVDNSVWNINFEREIDSKIKQFRITTQDQDLHILNKDELTRIIDESGICHTGTK